MTKTRVAILIDGGYLRAITRSMCPYTPDFIEEVALRIITPDEQLFRVLYYDCDPYRGEVTFPVSGKKVTFDERSWLDTLAVKNFFAVRRGLVKFRGFKLKNPFARRNSITEDDLSLDLQQKGVDMRLGIDIANFSISKAIDRIILVSSDIDCVPAMKYGRIAGLQIIIVQFPDQMLSPELLQHADGQRLVELSKVAQKFKGLKRNKKNGTSQ